MTERRKFVEQYEECLAGMLTMSELCRRHGISRKTGYKWLHRHYGGGDLEDRSSRPHRSPRAVASWLEDSIVAARKQRPTWGPRKLRAALLRANPGAELPSASTFALIFRRNGL